MRSLSFKLSGLLRIRSDRHRFQNGVGMVGLLPGIPVLQELRHRPGSRSEGQGRGGE